MSNNRRIKVINRSRGSLAYYIETLRVERHWLESGDYLNISIAELLELKTVPGGTNILEDCLLIEDKEALSLIFPDSEIEPEYAYGLEEVDFLLYEGTVEQLLDTLDYAPKGVLDLIKAKSIQKLPNETSKIKAINEKFSLDINKTHELNIQKDITPTKETPKKKRRTAPLVEEKEAETDIPTYNVIKKKN